MDDRIDELYIQGMVFTEIKEYKQAAECFREAAEWFHPDAQYRLAFCYEWGLGVKVDTTEAIFWYTRAAELNHVQAQCYLGDLYSSGEYVHRNDIEAFGWYLRAAKNGNERAMSRVGTMLLDGKGVAKDTEAGVKWLMEAALSCDVKKRLDKLPEDSIGIKRSDKATTFWWSNMERE